ncbi:DUF3365 domain-containing protein [Arcobacter sp. KX21116]|uniref:Tll0287-like domain-containing protein n=1 Tax=Arcobacter iocasae TaxID=2906515 RepID=UPI0035D3EDB0
MVIKNIKNVVLICSILITSYAFANKTLSEKEAKDEAINAIKQVGGTLKKHLGSEIKSGGVVQAATFCSEEATNLMKNSAANLPQGITIKRVTDKPRNPNNQATEAQIKVLNEIRYGIKKGIKPKMVVKKIEENHYQVYKPLYIENKCLACHGTIENRNKKAYSIIKAKYPKDKAIDYKLDDLRGAFFVDIKR